MFRLEHPIVSPTLILDLRDPVFGDILRVTHNAIIRDTRSGELKNFNDLTWPIIDTNVYQFTTITEIKAGEVKDFLSITAGLEVAINTDHLGQTWHGVLINPAADFVTQRDDCSVDFDLVFQGIKQ